ncbi:MAG: minor capsid protein [Desulfuromonadales bacterium]|nr:minor capsid protein [Desulfuromonadales bacterium]
MTAGLLEDLAAMLTAAGVVGGATGWTLRFGVMPDTPDQVVALFRTGGGLADHVRRPGVQIRVRGTTHSVTESKAEDVIGTLHGRAQVAGTGRTLIDVAMEGDMIWLGFDEAGRPEMTVNLTAISEES